MSNGFLSVLQQGCESLFISKSACPNRVLFCNIGIKAKCVLRLAYFFLKPITTEMEIHKLWLQIHLLYLHSIQIYINYLFIALNLFFKVILLLHNNAFILAEINPVIPQCWGINELPYYILPSLYLNVCNIPCAFVNDTH